MAALILAGGRGRRMGREKATTPLGDRTLLEHTAERARAVFGEVLVSGPPSLQRFGYPVVPDPAAGVGPLAGILAGLRAAAAPWVFVLPCDSPFVPEAFLRGMAAAIGDTDDAVVPRVGEFWEPLHALYARACAEPVASLIAAGERQIIRLYDRVRVKVVGPELLSRWDPEGLAFFNINTAADLECAQARLRPGRI